jgi:hypothetical protein
MFDCLYIASLTAHHLLIVYKAHISCTNKQIDFLALVSFPLWGSGKSGKLRAGNRYTKELSKILAEFPAGEEKIRENFRLYKAKMFPARKSLVSDSPGEPVKGLGLFLQCNLSLLPYIHN